MSEHIISSVLDEGAVLAILRAPEVVDCLVNHRPGDLVGDELCVSRLSSKAFQVTGSKGNFIIRFPGDEDELSRLRKEESVQRELRVKVHLKIPDTSVLEIENFPVFAIHRMIPGEPLTSDIYDHLEPGARDRLIMDLAYFFYETRNIPLATACEWLSLQEDEEKLTAAYGKPGWFGGKTGASMRASLAAVLDAQEMRSFEEVVNLFDALPVELGYMVFGHGDMHGFNMAMGEDALGPRLVGVFDLGCTGILDVHEDFFRLSLISEDLLERVIEKYQDLTGYARPLRRDRIAIYYRAFLFYLMCELTGENLDHLKKMLQRHVEYYQDTYGSIAG
jgi:hypothetical protein